MLLIYLSPLIASVVIGIFLVLLISRNPLTPSSIAVMALILGASLWSFGYALEFISSTLDTKLFWAKFQYFGITTIPLAWFIFSIHLLGSPIWLVRSRRYRVLLGVLPAITLGLVWTNELHSFVWQQVRLVNIGPIQILGIRHGVWFWVYWIYSYCLLFLGSIQLVRALSGIVRLHRWQIRLALLAILIPWIGNLAYITGWNPVPHLDWTPFSFTIAGLLFTASLFRFQLIKILPIAEKTVFAGLPDCMLVLDKQDCLVDMNWAAQAMIGNPEKLPLGKPLFKLLPELASWVSQAILTEEFQVEIPWGEKPGQRFYDLRVIPLFGPFSLPVGRLVVCHEITQLKREQARLEQAVAERTGELRQVVEQLQKELAQRALAEKQFKEVIEWAPEAMLLVDKNGSIMLVNAQAERLFGYSRAELLGKNIIESMTPLPHRDRQLDYLTQYIANPEIIQSSFGLYLFAQRKDGSEIPVEINLSSLETANGYWLVFNFRDITERMKAEQEQNRLLQEIKQSNEQMRELALRLQEAEERERRQIAAELHDRVGQNLTGLNLNLQILQNQLDSTVKHEVRNRLVDSQKLVEETTRQVRDVMADLHPLVLDEHGLIVAIQWYCRDFSNRTRIATQVKDHNFEPRLPVSVERVLFRLVQESLLNVAKHACASQVMICLESTQEAYYLTLEDNGLGFDQEKSNVPDSQPHWGLLTMQQRATSIGAQLSIESVPGRGTTISICYWR